MYFALYFYSVHLVWNLRTQMLLLTCHKYLRASTRNMCPAFQDANNRTVLSAVPLHGDQLLEERARNVHWTFRDGESQYDTLEGLTTEHADWHPKVTLYKVVGTETILLLILTGFLYAGRSPLKNINNAIIPEKSHVSHSPIWVTKSLDERMLCSFFVILNLANLFKKIIYCNFIFKHSLYAFYF